MTLDFSSGVTKKLNANKSLSKAIFRRSKNRRSIEANKKNWSHKYEWSEVDLNFYR